MNQKKLYPLTAGIILAIMFAPLVAGRSSAEPAEANNISHFVEEVFLPEYTTPPDVSKVTVNSPDTEGYAVVQGAAGAVPANVAVAIINLSTRNISKATANSSGGFQSTIFSPPGSTLLIKYSTNPDLIELLWQHALNPGGDFSYMNPLPGASLFVPGSSPGTPGMPFHSAGYFGPGEGPDWAGWWISGSVEPSGGGSNLNLQPEDIVTLHGTITITSPGMGCTTTPSFTPPELHFQLRELFGPDGKARLSGPWFSSILFTPTGMPIEHEGPPQRIGVGSTSVTGLSCLSANTAQGTYYTQFDVPAGLAEGRYKLEAYIDGSDVPLASGIRKVVVWYHFDPIVAMPPITIGTPDSPQIPWTLFADHTTNGHRGVQAQENIDEYLMLTRTIFPPHQVVLPRLDPRSGIQIVYRLEPGSNWLSSTDRRFPNPAEITLNLPGGSLQATVHKPDSSQEVIGPFPIKQSSVTTPSLPDGTLMHEGTGHVGDIYHLHTDEPAFAYSFDQYGDHTIVLSGSVEDIYGTEYAINNTFEVNIARVLDLDPAQLPTTPYEQGDAFAPGLHIFPPMPADVEISVVHMPLSDPGQKEVTTLTGTANKYGYFQPPPGTEITFDSRGEFRVDISAEYEAQDGTHWAGYVTWGNVVEGSSPMIEAHGRRGMDYGGTKIDDMPAWFKNENLPPEKIGIENYYPYFSGDIHWGEEMAPADRRGDSIHSIITLRDLAGINGPIYTLIRNHYARSKNLFRQPPEDFSATGLESRLQINEAPLFITTSTDSDPTAYPEDIDMWGYWYGSSERPDVHVREIITEDGMGTAYWRFNDTYGYQIGEPANGDQPGDIKWEFGGVVFRVPGQGINEYAIYSSLWVLLPEGCDSFGCARVTAPFRGVDGRVLDGGPIMTLLGEDIDMLFLPKSIRPGDVLEVGDTIAFSGHVGPPLDSQVEVTITSPTDVVRTRTWHANKIGWLYDPSFDFLANEAGRWTVDVSVLHDRPYIGNGFTPSSHNTGTVLGTSGQYEFYVVEPGSETMTILWPPPGFIPTATHTIRPVVISGIAPPGTSKVHYTVHDKGIVMGQGTLTPAGNGLFKLSYDPEELHEDFSMLSLVSHDGLRLGLANEVSISLLAVGGDKSAATVTLIGEEIFVDSIMPGTFLPLMVSE